MTREAHSILLGIWLQWRRGQLSRRHATQWRIRLSDFPTPPWSWLLTIPSASSKRTSTPSSNSFSNPSSNIAAVLNKVYAVYPSWIQSLTYFDALENFPAHPFCRGAERTYLPTKGSFHLDFLWSLRAYDGYPYPSWGLPRILCWSCELEFNVLRMESPSWASGSVFEHYNPVHAW